MRWVDVTDEKKHSPRVLKTTQAPEGQHFSEPRVAVAHVPTGGNTFRQTVAAVNVGWGLFGTTFHDLGGTLLFGTRLLKGPYDLNGDLPIDNTNNLRRGWFHNRVQKEGTRRELSAFSLWHFIA